MAGRLPEGVSEGSAASAHTVNSMPKLIFVCDFIKPGNVNVPEYQRAKMFTENFRTAIVYRWDIPDSIRGRCEEAYRVRGRMLAALHGFSLILYLRIVRGYKIVYTGPNIFAIIWASLAKSLLGCRWIFDLWDHPSLELASARTLSSLVKKPLYDIFLQRRLADADAWIIAMHMDVLDHMPKPYPKNKIVHVTNGIDLSNIEHMREHEAQLHEGKGGTVLNVCYAGAVTAWRGMGILLECLESLGTEYSIRVELFGENLKREGDDEILQALENLNHSSPHKVRYHGNLPHKEALAKIAESEVGLCILKPFVLSYDYSYNVKIFEYLALGKVIVASRTTAFSEVIRDGDNGFLISFSAEDLRTAFDRIIELKQRGELVRIKRAARETAKLYRWEDINKKILLHLDAVLKDV